MDENTNFMTMREYAHKAGVTYEAVRVQVSKYKKELEGHTQKKDGTKTILLDEYAIKFLQRHRAPRSIVVSASDEETQAEIDRLNEHIRRLEAELRNADKKIIELHEAKEQLIADNARNEAYRMIADKEHEELETARKELIETKSDLKRAEKERNDLQAKNEETQKELNSYHKSIFGFYRKD